MADETQTQQQPVSLPQEIVLLDPISQQQKAIAEAARKAEADQLDETIEGGAYLVNGAWVNAEGKPIKAPKGK